MKMHGWWRNMTAAVLAATLGLATVALAQLPEAEAPADMDVDEMELMAMGPDMGGMPPHAMMPMHRFGGRGGRGGGGFHGRAFEQLDLTDAQRTQIEDIQDKQRRSAINMRKDLELAGLDLSKLIGQHVQRHRRLRYDRLHIRVWL